MVSPVAAADRESSLRVFPNPVTNNGFFVQYSGMKINEVKLVASDGKRVPCNFNLQKSNLLRISLPAFLARGIYTLQLETDKGLQSTLINLQ